ncbi:MAG: NAD-binding protein [Desulfomicrobium escambiense]|nr:NAD-binding protein [Desulfomicrobium escambiense]
MEMAHVFSNLGAEVTVIEALDRILATEDEEVSRSAGITIQEGAIHYISKDNSHRKDSGIQIIDRNTRRD